ncbi:MAG: hypothetical protein QMD86_02050 [Patescibacteria group bacterium]|nr:hypothetical protein [Patescibacteria group bacterium]
MTKKIVAIILLFLLSAELLPHKTFAEEIPQLPLGGLNVMDYRTGYFVSPPNAPSDSSPDTSSIFEKSVTNQITDYRGSYLPEYAQGEYFWFSGDYIGAYVAQVRVATNQTPLLTENQLTAQVKYKNKNQVDVIVNPKLVQDSYSFLLISDGYITRIENGDQTSKIKAKCADENFYNSGYIFYEQWLGVCIDQNGNATDAVYKDGRTYFLRVGGGWRWVTQNDMFIPTVTGHYEEAGSVGSVTRPLNSDIVYISKPKCIFDESDGWFKTTATVDCDTYGLSADGRVGHARYRDSKSGFGGILGPTLIGIVNIFIPIPGAGFIAQSLGLKIPDLILSTASMPGGLGTVENSNNLGLGNWEWWGGFKVPPTIELRVPSIIEYPDPILIAWSSEKADSCSASGDWSGSKPLSGSELSYKSRGTYYYTITCSNRYGSTSETGQVKVIRVPRCSFSANPSAIILPQNSEVLWNCLYDNVAGSSADYCSIDNDVGTVSNKSGTQKVRPSKSTIYTLSCSAEDGFRTFQTSVNIGFTPYIKEIIPR